MIVRVDFEEVVQYNQEHGRAPEEYGERVELAVGYHLDRGRALMLLRYAAESVVHCPGTSTDIKHTGMNRLKEGIGYGKVRRGGSSSAQRGRGGSQLCEGHLELRRFGPVAQCTKGRKDLRARRHYGNSTPHIVILTFDTRTSGATNLATHQNRDNRSIRTLGITPSHGHFSTA